MHTADTTGQARESPFVAFLTVIPYCNSETVTVHDRCGTEYNGLSIYPL